MSLSVILTCYNESPMIFETYEKIAGMMRPAGIAHDFIIVDDGSAPEVKRELVDYFGAKTGITLILSGENEGRGMAVTKGIRASSEEFALFIDTDLEIPESSIFSLYNAMMEKRVDIVIGKRIYLLGWNVNDWIRHVCSRAYFLLSNLVLGLGFLDTETGVKLFRRQKILPILDTIQDKRWFWDTEIIAESIRNNLKVSQIPVFLRRTNKKSSVKIFRDACRYLKSLYEYKVRPK